MKKLDEIWEESLLHMISGNYPNIVGMLKVTLADKNLYKSEIWFHPYPQKNFKP